MIFNIDYPTKVLIGEDASSQAGQKLKEHDISNVLCVYDPGIKSAGLVDKVVKKIRAEGIKVIEYGEVTPDPYDKAVNEAGELGRKEGADAVIGIGGGSSLDAAKATNVLLGNPGRINEYFGMDIPQKPGKFLVLIPTTSGTGSEISQVAAIGDSASGKKLPVIGPNCTADLAIVDPLLTLGLPPFITAYTGVDTLAHAIEAYTSSLSVPISDIIAIEAISLVARSLATAVRDGSDIKARSDMSFASTLAGMAFFQAFPHLGHCIGTPLGTRYHLPHGLSIAIVLPCIVGYFSDIMPDKVRAIGRALGLKMGDDIPGEEAGRTVDGRIRELNREVGIPTMKESNIPESDLQAIAEDTFNEPLIDIVPKKTGVEDVLRLLKKEYSY
ncbi:MAG: iron-containing alcohol dehydrogenase [Deltaproteobacteria bacterium]|nr:iron-containing alcohol dehydrogenase [Deltaproteobacteria bacterium]